MAVWVEKIKDDLAEKEMRIRDLNSEAVHLRADLADARMDRMDPTQFVTRNEHNLAIDLMIKKHGDFAKTKATEITNLDKQVAQLSKMLTAKDADIKALEKDLTHQQQIGAMGAKTAFFGGALAAKQDEHVVVSTLSIMPCEANRQALDTSTDSGLSDTPHL